MPVLYIFFIVLLGIMPNLTLASAAEKLMSVEKGDRAYVGSSRCAACHQQQYEDWQESDHFQSMLPASGDNVLGDFNDVEVTFHNIKTRFSQKIKAGGDSVFFIETEDETGSRKSFKVDYTFGFYPLQQYLIARDNGHIQAFNIAWDSRPQIEGGQRWYHLQPDEDISAQHPFFWTGSFSNWNSRCAECHSTNLEKNYSAETFSYNTTWSEVNVACEACHGPGKNHVNLVESEQFSDDNTGFVTYQNPGVVFAFNEGEAIASPLSQKSPHVTAQIDEINTCGRCHSRRMQLGSSEVGDDFNNQYLLQLLDSPLYFHDGQIQDEVFVLGSFKQSKMHQQGVTCSHCHNPHSGKLKASGNAVCTQCHQQQVYDVPTHHQHNDGLVSCVDCHMPERTYMGVDPRRDHSFVVPDLITSQQHDSPLVCGNCHSEKDQSWLQKAFSFWPKQAERASDHWAGINKRASQADASVTSELVAALNDKPDLIKATLLQKFTNFPSQVGFEAAQAHLRDPNPLVRRAAIAVFASAPANVRWQFLSPLLEEKLAAVRYDLAQALIELTPMMANSGLPVVQRKRFQQLMRDYKQYLDFNADSPNGQLALAQYYRYHNDLSASENAYRNALKISPNSVRVLVNYSDFKRQQGDAVTAEKLLMQALVVAPDSAAAQHSMGLSLVRKKAYQQALKHLKAAAELLDSTARYAYVYAVALEGQNQRAQAILFLESAVKRYPGQPDLLLSLVLYLQSEGELKRARHYLSELSRIAPGSPQVKQLQQRLK